MTTPSATSAMGRRVTGEAEKKRTARDDREEGISTPFSGPLHTSESAASSHLQASSQPHYGTLASTNSSSLPSLTSSSLSSSAVAAMGSKTTQEDDSKAATRVITTTTTTTTTTSVAIASKLSRDGDEEDGGDTGGAAGLSRALRHEHELPLLEALRLYPQAVGWSLYMSIGVIMLAFDPQIVGSMFAMPEFQREFGVPTGRTGYGDEYVIPAAWQTALTMGSPLGQIIGALASAYPMEWFGRKWTFFGCVFLTACLIIIQFLARDLQMLLVGELLCGLVLGCFVVIGPTYASEVCPVSLRGYLTSYTNLCFVTGQLLGNAVTAASSHLDNHWAYSIPFGMQWVWTVLILPGIFFVPESPWHLVRQGRMAAARDALRRLSSKGVDVDATLAVIAETDRLEMELESGSSYMDTVRGSNLRRTEIAAGVYIAQVLSGVYLISYGTYFFQQAGLPTQDAFYMGIGFLAVGWVCTVGSWSLLAHFGRRRILNTGLAALAALMLLIGILDTVATSTSPSGRHRDRRENIPWAISSLMLVWNGVYGLSVGPVAFTVMGECSATRVRSRTIAVATAAQAVVGIVMTVAIPYLINPEEANLQGKLGYFFAGLGACCLTWSWLRVPETSGRTYEELDLLFEGGVPARRFRDYRFPVVEAVVACQGGKGVDDEEEEEEDGHVRYYGGGGAESRRQQQQQNANDDTDAAHPTGPEEAGESRPGSPRAGMQ